MASGGKGRTATAGGQRDKGDTAKNEGGEEKSQLALEEFFHKYVDQWFRQGKVDSYLYVKCRKEIDVFQGRAKKSKTKKPKKINNTNLDCVVPVRQQPDLDAAKKFPHQESKKGAKEKPSPASVPQEQYVPLTQNYQEAIDTIQELEEEMAKLRADKESISRTVEHLRGELKRSYAQVNDFQTRYSKLASEALKNNNPNIADLSDPYRPTEITKQFSELYDNEWSDAFEALTNTLKCSEKESLCILLHIVERSFEFMVEQREEQVQLIRQALLCPVSSVLKKEDTKTEDDLNKFIAKENMEIQIKEIRKTHSPTTSTILAKVFRDIELERLLAPQEKVTNSVPEALKKYAYRCAQLSWHMVVADPPICISKSVANEPFDLDVYKPYTKSIKGQEEVVVETHVWPALYLHAGGPLLNKGVAQPGHARRK